MQNIIAELLPMGERVTASKLTDLRSLLQRDLNDQRIAQDLIPCLQGVNSRIGFFPAILAVSVTKGYLNAADIIVLDGLTKGEAVIGIRGHGGGSQGRCTPRLPHAAVPDPPGPQPRAGAARAHEVRAMSRLDFLVDPDGFPQPTAAP